MFTFELLSLCYREDKLKKLIPILVDTKNQEEQYDMTKLDNTYELTMDNCLKILAIHMKLKCYIPIVLMGETGCGKTRLIKFYADLLKPPENFEKIKNLVIMRVNGGTTIQGIQKKVEEAQELAKTNIKKQLDTLLFFDEANTTEAIHAIKEIICDKTLNGKNFDCKSCRIKIIASCNPYKKHSNKIIEELQNAGLGYFAAAEKYNRTPMRHLVYRVQALPHGLFPFVWDFGKLSPEIEKLYIRQITAKSLNVESYDSNCLNLINEMLAESHSFISKLDSENRFLSLRDVERFVKVYNWFFFISKDLFEHMNKKDKIYNPLNNSIRCITLSLGVCYYSSLKDNRKEYLQRMSNILNKGEYQTLIFRENPAKLSEDLLEKDIVTCQNVFLDGLDLKSADSKNPIAKNDALRENVWMMIVCIELKIPLFVIGKPGTSKSLAKVKVEEAMQGKNSTHDLFKKLKEIKICSYQCSRNSISHGIVEVFDRAKELKNKRNDNDFLPVVVLEEIGLAEDSPQMPLKALHSLLEDGSVNDEVCEENVRPAFIGISNWSLDPAKMNRGILKNCLDPEKEQLSITIKEICGQKEKLWNLIKVFENCLTLGYLDVVKNCKDKFFGLRDFYHLIKMVYYFCSRSEKCLSLSELRHVVKRNFSGLPPQKFDSLKYFKSKIKEKDFYWLKDENKEINEAEKFITLALKGEELKPDNRYVLLITENYAALDIVKYKLNFKYEVIFGSSFRKDNEYTHLCSNMNKIKNCMKAGDSVILLNLDPIYESLYDVLNQYHGYLGGERFVDIGFGTHKVKAKVHENFRLVVIAEQEDAKKFPIPLLNRLEKHYLIYETLLTKEELNMIDKIKKWIESFESYFTDISKIFKGYGENSVANLFFSIEEEDKEKVIKKKLLRTATIESLIQYDAKIWQNLNESVDIIYDEQGDLSKVLETYKNEKFIQIVTHSYLLNKNDIKSMGNFKIDLYMIQNFESEYMLDNKLKESGNKEKILIIQTNTYDLNLLAFIKCKVESNLNNYRQVIVLLHLKRNEQKRFEMYGSKWTCLFLDELRSPIFSASISALMKYSVTELFERSENQEKKELDCEAVIKHGLLNACSKLCDEKDNSKRLNILKQLENDVEFLTVLKRKVAIKLKAVGKSQKDWVKNEVSINRNVIEAGTFEKSYSNFISCQVEDILASILAWCETNYNLTLLQDSTTRQNWIKIFKDERFEKEIYSELLKRDFYIKHIISSETTMNLPFSWVIFEKASHFTFQHLHKNLNKSALMNQLKDEPLLKLFDDIYKDWYSIYLKDAVKMLHKPITDDSDTEYEVNFPF